MKGNRVEARTVLFSYSVDRLSWETSLCSSHTHALNVSHRLRTVWHAQYLETCSHIIPFQSITVPLHGIEAFFPLPFFTPVFRDIVWLFITETFSVSFNKNTFEIRSLLNTSLGLMTRRGWKNIYTTYSYSIPINRSTFEWGLFACSMAIYYIERDTWNLIILRLDSVYSQLALEKCSWERIATYE